MWRMRSSASPSADQGETPVAFMRLTARGCRRRQALPNERWAKRSGSGRWADRRTRSSIGKILKRELRDALCGGLNRANRSGFTKDLWLPTGAMDDAEFATRSEAMFRETYLGSAAWRVSDTPAPEHRAADYHMSAATDAGRACSTNRAPMFRTTRWTSSARQLLERDRDPADGRVHHPAE